MNRETQAILAEIEAQGWFVEGQDIARFCMAYAIRAKVPEGATVGTESAGLRETSTRREKLGRY